MTAEFPVAVHGLVYLWHKNKIVSSQELADNICTNPARVRKIMAKLKAAGLVSASEGKGSGYMTVPLADEINLAQILTALDNQVVTAVWRSGDIDKACQISSGMGAVMDGIYGELNEICFDKLEKITVGDINNKIFNQNGSNKNEI